MFQRHERAGSKWAHTMHARAERAGAERATVHWLQVRRTWAERPWVQRSWAERSWKQWGSSATVVLVASLALAGQALADCAGANVSDAKRAYESALTSEKQGRQEQALLSFHGAEGFICEGVNPYEADAAKRAAPLGLALGSAAERAGDFRKALEMYDAGGHFALGDRALIAMTRAKQDEPMVFQAAREHFDTRASASFQSNNAAALRVTGAYRPDPQLIAEVAAMPVKAVERAAQKESAAFNEQYLREYLQMIQSRPEDVTDATSVQRMISAQQAFAQKWQQRDLMKESRSALQLMRMWGLNGGNEALAKSVQTQVAQRAEQHAQVLLQKFSGAPKLLEDARDFIHFLELEPAKSEARIASLRTLAIKLGDEAGARQRFTLAADYYEVAGESAKADAVRMKQQQLAMQKMQPSIDAARRQAEAMRRAMQQ